MSVSIKEALDIFTIWIIKKKNVADHFVFLSEKYHILYKHVVNLIKDNFGKICKKNKQ